MGFDSADGIRGAGDSEGLEEEASRRGVLERGNGNGAGSGVVELAPSVEARHGRKSVKEVLTLMISGVPVHVLVGACEADVLVVEAGEADAFLVVEAAEADPKAASKLVKAVSVFIYMAFVVGAKLEGGLERVKYSDGRIGRMNFLVRISKSKDDKCVALYNNLRKNCLVKEEVLPTRRFLVFLGVEGEARSRWPLAQVETISERCDDNTRTT